MYISPFDSIADCSSHPLRVGYYASPKCGSLHTLTDADGRRYAEFARLGYDTGTDKYYHEYSAGRYLSIKLTKRARIYGIAVEGSPRNLRYYLKSMEIWYKVSFNNFSALSGSSTFESFYKESGMKKVSSSRLTARYFLMSTSRASFCVPDFGT